MCHEIRPHRLLWLVFTTYPPIPTEVSSPPERNDNAKLRRHPKPQQHPNPQRHHHLLSPSCPNVSQRWIFQWFQCRFHCFHLPHIQTRAGGGPFWRFNMSGTTTSLASKCELEVDFSVVSKLPPLPPPSYSNASQKQISLAF